MRLFSWSTIEVECCVEWFDNILVDHLLTSTAGSLQSGEGCGAFT